MKYNIIPVQTPKATDARLYTYILDNFEEIDARWYLSVRAEAMNLPPTGRQKRLQYSILPEDFMPASCATA